MDVGAIALSGQTTIAAPFSPIQNTASGSTAVSGFVSAPAPSPSTGSLPVALASSVTSGTSQSTASESTSLQKSAASLNHNAQPQFGSIEFSVDQQSDKMVLKVVDQETKQVLLQIPSKVALILSETIGNGGAGSLIRESA